MGIQSSVMYGAVEREQVTHIDPEKMNWSHSPGGGQRRRKMRMYSQQREGSPQRYKVRGDRKQPEYSN